MIHEGNTPGCPVDLSTLYVYVGLADIVRLDDDGVIPLRDVDRHLREGGTAQLCKCKWREEDMIICTAERR